MSRKHSGGDCGLHLMAYVMYLMKGDMLNNK